MTAGVISQELKVILRRLKLAPLLDTLPERISLARQRKMSHQDFLELVLADELTPRDAKSAVSAPTEPTSIPPWC